jgi:hypothetical protein
MLVDNRDVPQARLPHHIKQIAEYRNGAEPSFDRYIHQHPDDLRA